VLRVQDLAASAPGVGGSSGAGSSVMHAGHHRWGPQGGLGSTATVLLDPGMSPDALAVTLASRKAAVIERESSLQARSDSGGRLLVTCTCNRLLCSELQCHTRHTCLPSFGLQPPPPHTHSAGPCRWSCPPRVLRVRAAGSRRSRRRRPARLLRWRHWLPASARGRQSWMASGGTWARSVRCWSSWRSSSR
jgi:hypothetical protein